MLRNALTGLFLCLVAGGVLADDTKPLPVETFFSYPQIWQIKISPDGKYLALVVADPKTHENRKRLVIMTADSSHKATASIGTKNYQIIYDFWWTLDDRILAATATTDTGFFEAPALDGTLYAINADGTKQIELMPAVPGANRKMVGGVTHDEVGVYFGGPLYMQSDDPKKVLVYGLTRGLDHSYHSVAQAYLVDVYTGEFHLALESPLQDGRFISDSSGAIRLATGQNVKTGDRELLYRASDDSHDWKDLTSALAGDDSAAPENGADELSPDGKSLYWYGRTATSTLGLYSLDIQSQKLSELYSDPDVDVDDVIWSFDWIKPRKIIAVDTMPGLPAVHIIDGDDPKAQYLASLYQAFEGQKVRITSNTSDGAVMVVQVTSDKNPGDFYLFNGKTGKAEYLFSSKPEIDPKQMGDMRPVSFQARDGLTIHGYLTVPAGSDGKNLPLIINPHGGPHGIRDEWGWNREAQFFASRGYAVLQVNYRGSGGYGMKFQDAGYGQWAGKMQDDLADGVQWAVKQGFADPNRVCIYGASYGGYAALENAERYPSLYKCVVGYVGVYDLALMDDSDFSHYASGKNYLGVTLGRNDVQLKAESPVSGADKLAAPVFIIYGGQDKRVVPKNAEEMMAAMDKAGKKYEKLYQPLEQHGFYQPDHNYELYTRMIGFFDEYIGANTVKH